VQHRLLGTAHPALVAIVCSILKRLDDAMRYLLIQRSFAAATRLLITYCVENPAFRGLWRKNLHVLMKHYPLKLVREGLIPHSGALGLQPHDIAGPLHHYATHDNEPDPATGRRPRDHAVIEYLTHVVDREGNTDEATHNMLLAILARDGSDDALLAFIQGSKYLNSRYALRECQRRRRHAACVELYMRLRQYRDAVKLAVVAGNVALAKEKVREVGDDATRQHLWRGIARYTLGREGGPKQSLLLLGEAVGDLAMNDVLPHFSDDVMVCDFKAELVQAVNWFDKSMEQTFKDTETRQAIARVIREDIRTQQRQIALVQSMKKCEHCKQPALSRRYVLFPSCGHVFHAACHEEAARTSALRGDLTECFLCSHRSLAAGLTATLTTTDSAALAIRSL